MVLEHLLVGSGTSVHNDPASYCNSTTKCYGTIRYCTTKCYGTIRYCTTKCYGTLWYCITQCLLGYYISLV